MLPEKYLDFLDFHASWKGNYLKNVQTILKFFFEEKSFLPCSYGKMSPHFKLHMETFSYFLISNFPISTQNKTSVLIPMIY